MAKLGYVIRGFKKLATAKQRPRLPITSILRQLKGMWETMEDSFNGRVFWAAACMCFLVFSEQERWWYPPRRCMMWRLIYMLKEWTVVIQKEFILH